MSPSLWRRKRGLSLSRVAELLGCGSPSTVLRYERGVRDVPNSVSLAYSEISNGAVTASDLARVRKGFLRQQDAA